MRVEASRRHRARVNDSPRDFVSLSCVVQKNFGRPIEYGMVKQHPWSVPTLQKLDFPVDVDGNPWPLDAEGKPILKDVPEDDEQFA